MQSMCQNNAVKKKCTMFLSKILTFIYDHLLYSGRKHFCFYCLQAFSGEEILKRHIQDYFKGTL